MSLFLDLILLTIVECFNWLLDAGEKQKEIQQRNTMERDFIILDDLEVKGHLRDLEREFETCDHEEYDGEYYGEW
jgi:hypothetical protein